MQRHVFEWGGNWGLCSFTNESHAVLEKEKKNSPVSDRLIGRIFGPLRLVLMWRTDGRDGIPANPPFYLNTTTPPPMQDNLPTE